MPASRQARFIFTMRSMTPDVLIAAARCASLGWRYTFRVSKKSIAVFAGMMGNSAILGAPPCILDHIHGRSYHAFRGVAWRCLLLPSTRGALSTPRGRGPGAGGG